MNTLTMWFESKFYESLKEEDEEATLYDCFNENPLCEYVNDFINLNITQENYLKLIELCDFLMVENSDILVNKIVQCFGKSIIHNFGYFYKYNCKRLQVHDKESLKQAIQLYCQNKKNVIKLMDFHLIGMYQKLQIWIICFMVLHLMVTYLNGMYRM